MPALDAGYARSRLRRIAAELVTGPAAVVFSTGSNAWRVEGNGSSDFAAGFNSLADVRELPVLLFVGHGWPARPWKALALALGLLAAAGVWLAGDRVPGRFVESCAWFGIAGLCAFGLRSSFF